VASLANLKGRAFAAAAAAAHRCGGAFSLSLIIIVVPRVVTTRATVAREAASRGKGHGERGKHVFQSVPVAEKTQNQNLSMKEETRPRGNRAGGRLALLLKKEEKAKPPAKLVDFVSGKCAKNQQHTG
jgi:hypothetical protein